MRNKILGFVEEINVCGCCGKGNLKGTYAIQDAETGDINYFGSVCAFKNFNLNSKELKAGVKAAELENIKAAKKEYMETPEYLEHRQQMIDREPFLVNCDDETWFRITRESVRLGRIADMVKQEICKKYNVKKTYMV